MIVTPVPSPEYHNPTFSVFEATDKYYQTSTYPSPVMSESALHHHTENGTMDCYRQPVPLERTVSNGHGSQHQPYFGGPMTAPPSRYSASPSISSTLSTSGLHVGLGRDEVAAGYSEMPYPSAKLARTMPDYPMTIQPVMLGNHHEHSPAFSQRPSASSSSEFATLEHFSYPSTSNSMAYSPAASMAGVHAQLLQPAPWTSSAPGWDHMEPCHLAITNEPSPASEDGEGSVDSHDEYRRSASLVVKQEDESLEPRAYFTAGERAAGSEVAERRAKPQRTQWTPPDKVKFTCELCGRGFSRQWNYRIHKETHQHDSVREKPHKCELPGCDLSFRRPTDLKRHQNCVHKKSKEFKCERCGAGFPRKDSLQRHEVDGCPRRIAVKRRTKPTRKSASTSSTTNTDALSRGTAGPSPPLTRTPYVPASASSSPYMQQQQQHEYAPSSSTAAAAASSSSTSLAYPAGHRVVNSYPQWRHVSWYNDNGSASASTSTSTRSGKNRVKEES